jgi:tetratricopeptide (TPR) repeat protein
MSRPLALFVVLILAAPVAADDAVDYFNRGNAWYDKKEYDKATTAFTEAIRLDPKFSNAYVNRGLAWDAKKEYDKAIADYTKAIELDPNHVGAYVNRGLVWYYKKDYDKAVADCEKALEFDPKIVAAIINKARVLAKLKKYDEAVKGFDTAIGLYPVDWLHRDYALFLASCPDAKYRDGKKAAELAKKAVEKVGKGVHWEYLSALAAAYAEVGDFELAVAEQRKVLEDKSLDKDDKKQMELRLELYRMKKPYRDE